MSYDKIPTRYRKDKHQRIGDFLDFCVVMLCLVIFGLMITIMVTGAADQFITRVGNWI